VKKLAIVAAALAQKRKLCALFVRICQVLQRTYNQQLIDNPGMQGRITVRWSIDEFGNIISAKLVSSTVNDLTFEQTVVSRIRSLVFGRINVPGDITEVEHPFEFIAN